MLLRAICTECRIRNTSKHTNSAQNISAQKGRSSQYLGAICKNEGKCADVRDDQGKYQRNPEWVRVSDVRLG